MRTLVVEDDFAQRKIISKLLGKYGEVDVAVNGREAVDAFRAALDDGTPYDLICMDIMMPVMNGADALREIRAVEEERFLPADCRARIVMISAVGDSQHVLEAFAEQCDGYLVKPIKVSKLRELLEKLEILVDSD